MTENRKRDAYYDDTLRVAMPPKRKCHDCGRPTDDFRCPECWVKKREGLGGGVETEFYEVLVRHR